MQSKSRKNSFNEEKENFEAFKPRINNKSKYLDSKRGTSYKNRVNRLQEAGNMYKLRRERRLMEKQKLEEEELANLPFKPKSDSVYSSRANLRLSIAERSAHWAKKREERVLQKKNEYDSVQAEICSFKPNINSKIKFDHEAPESLYSSRFVQDGLKDYFTRLEQARKIKLEKKMRLENWGKERSGVDRNKNGNRSVLGSINVSYVSHNSEFESGSMNEGFTTPSKFRQKKSVGRERKMDETIEILRRNLQGINIVV